MPGPDGLDRGRYDNPYIESRDVPALDDDPVPFARRAWFRPTAPVPDDPLLHLQVLAYLSDHGPTRAAREPHAHLADDARRMSVSLDHSVWFHRPIDVNQWLLSELVPVATGRGRGLSIGTLRTPTARSSRRSPRRSCSASGEDRNGQDSMAGRGLSGRPTATDVPRRSGPRRQRFLAALGADTPLVHWMRAMSDQITITLPDGSARVRRRDDRG